MSSDPDLDNELRRVLGRLGDAAGPAPTFDELTIVSPAEKRASNPIPRQRWIIPALAAVVVVVVGLVVLLGLGDGDGNVTSGQPTPTAVTSPTARPTPTETPAPTTTPVPAPTPVPESERLSSATWTRATLGEAGFAESSAERTEISSMEVSDGRFVAVGYLAHDSGADGSVDAPGIWTSTDGESWVGSELAGAQQAEGLHDVVAGPSGLVAVGDFGGGAIGGPPSGSGVVWRSTDGTVWERHEPVEWATFVPRAITTAPDGSYVVVGATSSSETVLWRSVGGLEWTLVESFESAEPRQLLDIDSGPSGLVAVGVDGPADTGRARILWSPDGITWTDVAVDPDIFPTGTSLDRAFARPDGGFVAVGRDFGSSISSVMWASADGVAWERLHVFDTEGQTLISELTTLPEGTEVAVGGETTLPGPDHPSVSFASRLWVLGEAPEQVLTEVSPAGATAEDQLVLVAAGEGRIVIVGRAVDNEVAIWTVSYG